MKKVLIITGITLVALLLIVAFAVSPIAEKYIENNSKELIGRKIEMENLSVNIFTGRLKKTLAVFEKSSIKNLAVPV